MPGFVMLATFAKLPVPLVLPTQRKVAPEDVKYLAPSRCPGFNDRRHHNRQRQTAFGQIVRSFREAIDKLGDKYEPDSRSSTCFGQPIYRRYAFPESQSIRDQSKAK